MEFDVIVGPGVGLTGREQWLVVVGKDDEYGEVYERATLLLEPL